MIAWTSIKISGVEILSGYTIQLVCSIIFAYIFFGCYSLHAKCCQLGYVPELVQSYRNYTYKCKYDQRLAPVWYLVGDIKEKSITDCDCLQQNQVLIMFSVLIHDCMIYKMNCYYGIVFQIKAEGEHLLKLSSFPPSICFYFFFVHNEQAWFCSRVQFFPHDTKIASGLFGLDKEKRFHLMRDNSNSMM